MRRGSGWRRAAACVGLFGLAALLGGERVPARAAVALPLLTLNMEPSLLPADGTTEQALYLELLGPSGAPVGRDLPTPVVLRSSDPQVATVPPLVEIPAHTPLMAVPVATTDQPGTAVITATSPGLVATSAKVTTTPVGGGTGLSLHLVLQPSRFFAGGQGPAWATIEVLGPGGSPAPTRSPLTLTLVSSAPGVVSLPPTAVIPAGSYDVTVDLTLGRQGPATLTALADGYNPGIASTGVLVPGSSPAALQVTVQPPVVLPGGAVRLVLQATDASGQPVAFPCVPVYLSSNAPTILDVPTKAQPTCGPEVEAAALDVGPAAGVGTASVTVAAPGLAPATVEVEVVSPPPPDQLHALVAPPVLARSSVVQGYLVVQATDSTGQPLDVPRALTVRLQGAGSALPATVTIPADHSLAAVPIRGPGVSGERLIVAASAPGFTSATASLGGATPTLLQIKGPAARALLLFGVAIQLRWLFVGEVAAVVALGGVLLAMSRRSASLGRH